MLLDDSSLYGNYYSPVCSHCNNLIDPIQHTCIAFNSPRMIPDEIWSGKNKHTSHVDGDNNILFKQITKKTLKATS